MRNAFPFLFALTVFLASPIAAQAQRRSPLADAPAIRKRVELRQNRFELGAGFGSTVNETFYHGLLADVHLGYHITDWLAISVLGTFNVSTVATGFNDQLGSKLGDPAGRTPGKSDARGGMNKSSTIFGGRAELTPFTGKFSLFGSLFAHYDFSVFAGGALVNLAAVTPTAGIVACKANPDDTTSTCVASGSQVGGLGGLAFHSFFNDFVALSVELRDVVYKDNPAGRGVVVTGTTTGNGQPQVSNKDLSWSSHVMAILGVTVFFPTTASISP